MNPEFYQNNIKAFCKRYSEYAPLMESVESLSSRADTALAVDAALAEKHLASLSTCRDIECFFIGVCGGVPAHLFSKLGQTFVYYIMETDAGALAAAFAAYDYTPLIASELVLFFIGSDALNQYEQFKKKTPAAITGKSYYVINCSDETEGGAYVDMENDFRKLNDRINGYYERMTDRFLMSYRGPRPEEIAEKQARGEPLRIMLARYGNTKYLRHAMRDIAQAAEEIGHVTRTISDGGANRFSLAYLAKEISQFKPDIFFSLGASLTPYLLVTLNTIGLRQIVWFFDNPHFFIKPAHLEELEKPEVSVCVVTPGYFAELREIGYRGPISIIPLAYNDTLYNMKEQTPAAARYDHDVVFVGNIVPTRGKISDLDSPETLEIATIIRTFVNENVDTIFYPEEAAIRFLDYLESKTDADVSEISSLIHQLSMHIFREEHRLRFLRDVHARDLHVYGSGWEAYPDLKTIHSPIENGPELAALYRASRINLHIHELTLVHPRVLECLACGGFIISREVAAKPGDPTVADSFIPGSEIAVFRTRDEMNGLIDFYLSNPKQREELAAAGRARVLRDHTYRARIEKLLDAVFNPPEYAYQQTLAPVE
jgi:spore maturation protein CgeB